MRRQFYVFIIRWLLNSVGLWLAVQLLSDYGAAISPERGIPTFLFAGLVFSIVNSVIRPIVIILSLPVILITLGLFMFVVNGFMVWLSLKLVPGLSMTFTAAIVAGIIISLINYIVTSLLDIRKARGSQKI